MEETMLRTCLSADEPGSAPASLANSPSASASTVGHAEALASLPSLVLQSIWAKLSLASLRHLRLTCRALRYRVDADLLRTMVVGDRSHAAPLHLRLPPDLLHLLHCAADADPCLACPVAAASTVPSGAIGTRPNSPSPWPSPSSPSPSSPALQPGRFSALHALVLMPHVPSPSSSSHSGHPHLHNSHQPHHHHRAALPAPLRAFLSPPPSALLAPFASSRHLAHLILLDLCPGPAERDIALIAASFPALASLHLLASPLTAAAAAAAPSPPPWGPSSSSSSSSSRGGGVVPPLWALRGCAALRGLSVDLGRGGVMGSGSRASLGALTQLSRLVLGLADTGGDDREVVCCGTGGLADSLHHHHHHVYRVGSSSLPQRQEGEKEEEGDHGDREGSGAGGGALPAVVAAAVGGVEASLFCLAAGGLRSLELRVVSFGAYEARLLAALAAGGAAGGGGGGLRHLCIRLLPPPQHTATYSSSFNGGDGGGDGGGFMYGHAGGGEYGGAPSASLACILLALGNAVTAAAGGGGGGVTTTWAQPSEVDRMLVAVPALRSLTRLEVPELLLPTCHQLSCLAPLRHLTELHIGGVVAAGVAVPAAAATTAVMYGSRGGGGWWRGPVLPALTALTVDAESPEYGGGGGGAAPWWSVVCPALRRLSLTVLYGDGGAAALGAPRAGSPEARAVLGAALARVPHVRLVVIVSGSGAGASGGGSLRGDAAADTSAAALRWGLPGLLRGAGGTVRQLEIRSRDPVELLAVLDPDVLAGLDPVGGMGDGGGGAAAAVAAAAAATPTAEAGSFGMERRRAAGEGRSAMCLKLVTATAFDAPVSAASGELAASLLRRVAEVVQRASPPLGALCALEPWLVAAAGRQLACGGGGDAGGGGKISGPWDLVEALVGAAAARGTRLCLCGLEGEQRAGLVHELERRGLELAEGECLA